MIHLCPREEKIMQFIAEGLAFNEIAKKMQLSPRTIGFFVAEIKCKVEKSGGDLAAFVGSFEQNYLSSLKKQMILIIKLFN